MNDSVNKVNNFITQEYYGSLTIPSPHGGSEVLDLHFRCIKEDSIRKAMSLNLPTARFETNDKKTTTLVFSPTWLNGEVPCGKITVGEQVIGFDSRSSALARSEYLKQHQPVAA